MPHIFPTGDVIGFPILAKTSSEQGRLAACCALEVRSDLCARSGDRAGYILGNDSGLLKMLFHREDHRVLVIHVIGTGATGFPHRASRAGARRGLDYFLTMAPTYPTLAEWYEALDASNKLNA